jgi:methionyl-tRNA formyltransferase
MTYISLFCLGKKGLEVLKGLEDSSYALVELVVVGRDENVENDFAHEIIEFLEARSVKYVERVDLIMESVHSSFLFAIGWRWMIQQKEDQTLIVFHDSLLPKYRGFNPLVTALIKGDSLIGVTAIFGTDEFDKGDVIAQDSVEISYPIKLEQAINLVSSCYVRIARKILDRIQRNQQIIGRPQVEEEASYSLWRNEEDYIINWSQDADYISRMIDAVGYPYKGAYTFLNGSKVYIADSKVMQDVNIENRTPGKVIFKVDSYPAVVCGQGILILLRCNDDNGEALEFKNKFRLHFK